MKFYKTNRISDGGSEHTAAEVAEMFLASDAYTDWNLNGDELLDRCVLRWAANTLGGCDDPQDIEAMLDEVCYQRTERRRQARALVDEAARS